MGEKRRKLCENLFIECKVINIYLNKKIISWLAGLAALAWRNPRYAICDGGFGWGHWRGIVAIEAIEAIEAIDYIEAVGFWGCGHFWGRIWGWRCGGRMAVTVFSRVAIFAFMDSCSFD